MSYGCGVMIVKYIFISVNKYDKKKKKLRLRIKTKYM